MLYRYASLGCMNDLDSSLSQLISGVVFPEVEKAVASSYNSVMRGQRRMHDDPERWERNARDYLTEMLQQRHS